MKRFLLMLFWLCLPGISWGAITFDAQSESTMFDAIGFSWTHTIGGSCTNNVVNVAIGFGNANATTLTGVTVGGAAATQIATVASDSGVERITTFRLVGTGTGGKTVAVSFSGANALAIGTARSYCGDAALSLGTPVTNSSGSSGTVTVAVSSATGELVIDSVLIISLPVTATVGAGQTQRSNLTDLFGADWRQVESDEAGAASVTMSWTLGEAHPWLAIGVPLKESSAAASGKRRIIVVE